VPLAKPRDQIQTREERIYLDIRHDVLSRIRAMKTTVDRTRPSEGSMP
jgi:hypothetical protein